MGYTSVVNTLLLAAVLVFTGACAGKQKGLRETQRETQQLGEAATIYWRALRFQDYSVASTYIRDQGLREAWLMDMSQGALFRYSSAVVVSVEVDDEHPLDDAGNMREGRVFVQIEGYRLPDPVVQRQLLSLIHISEPTSPLYRT